MTTKHVLYKLSAACAIALMSLVITACSSDDEKWEPGPSVKEGCQQVHFAGSNPTLALATNGGMDLIVKREITTGSLTVPVKVLSASEGVVVPDHVSFADGESTTTLTVSVPENATTGDSFSYELRLEGDEVDPYADLDGTSYFKGLISFALVRRAQLYISGYTTDKLGWWGEEVYEIEPGTYVIKNFCRSGLGLRISVDSENYVVVSAYGFEPYITYADYGNFLYLTYHDDEYISFNPWGDDFPINITTMNIFNGSGVYKGYGRYYPSTDRMLITLGSFQTTAESSGTTYVSMYLKFRPEGLSDTEKLEWEAANIYKPNLLSE